MTALLDDARPVTLSCGKAGAGGSGLRSRPIDLSFDIAGQDQFAFVTVLEGAVEFDRGKGVDRYALGDVYLGPVPQDDPRSRASGCAQRHTINVPVSLFDDLTRESAGRSPMFEFLSRRPLAGGSRRWRGATRLVNELLTGPDPIANPLMIASAARMLAATALAIFPNTAVTPAPTDCHDVHPGTLAQAIDFIDANSDLDVELADIARAAGVTARAVQLAFHRNLDTTPMAYLRQIRLGHAHRELEDAMPDDGLTVIRVALDWRFANPGRFAAYYRAAYGQSPSDTLKS